MTTGSDPATVVSEQRPSLTLRRVALGTLLVLAVALSFWLVVQLRYVLVTCLLGILIATMLQPTMDLLRGWRVPRPLAATIALLPLVLLLVGLILLIPASISQVSVLGQELPQAYSNLRNTLTESRYSVVRQFGFGLPNNIGAGSYSDLVVAQLVLWLPTIGYGLFLAASTFLLTYYWLLYRERSVRGLLLLLPLDQRERGERLWIEIEQRMGAFLRGQLLLMLIVGIGSLVGFWLIGLPYALLVAITAGILELVPFIGPIVSATLAVLVGWSVSPVMALSALVIGSIVQQIENTILVPRIMDQAVGVSPIVTLLSIVGFGAILGPIGAILAIPLAAIVQVIFEAWLSERAARAADEKVQGRGMIDRLRYEIQHLTEDVRGYVRRKERETGKVADIAEEDLERLLVEIDELLQQNGTASP